MRASSVLCFAAEARQPSARSGRLELTTWGALICGLYGRLTQIAEDGVA